MPKTKIGTIPTTLWLFERQIDAIREEHLTTGASQSFIVRKAIDLLFPPVKDRK